MFKPRRLLECLRPLLSSRRRRFAAPHRSSRSASGTAGSTAFWFEYFQPDKLVAVDYLEREDSDYFRGYVDGRGIADRLKTYWGVDQADSERLREIVDAEFDGARSTS